MIGRLGIRLGRQLLVTWSILTLLFLLTRTLPDEQQLLARFGGIPTGAAPSVGQIRCSTFPGAALRPRSFWHYGGNGKAATTNTISGWRGFGEES
jgi:hypothetical protein